LFLTTNSIAVDRAIIIEVYIGIYSTPLIVILYKLLGILENESFFVCT